MIQDSNTLIQYYDDLLNYTEDNVSDVSDELKMRGVSCVPEEVHVQHAHMGTYILYRKAIL